MRLDVGGARTMGLHWGLVGQVLSSGTNFGLSLMAGRELGPKGLGIVFVGFSTYLLVSAVQRAVLVEPVVVASVGLSVEERRSVTRSAIGLVLVGGVVLSGVMALAGVAVGGSIGSGLLTFAPWIVPLLVQDAWRAFLFRDGRGSASAANDAVWAVVMLAALPLPLIVGRAWAIVAWWAMGALGAALFGFVQTRLAPGSIREGFEWWRRRAWSLGRWLGVETALSNLGSQAVVLIFAAVVGLEWLGGFRSVQSVFAPMTLLNPAINLPGLPAIARTVATSRADALTMAGRLSAVAAASAFFYLGLLGSIGGWLLGTVFGSEFRMFAYIIVPLGIAQLVIAGGMGFTLLLKAEARGRAISAIRAAAVVVSITAATVLSILYGTRGAAWAVVLGPAVYAVAVILLATRPHGGDRAVPGTASEMMEELIEDATPRSGT